MKYLLPVFVLTLLLFPLIVQAANPLLPFSDACGELMSGEYSFKLCLLLIKVQWILYAIAFGLATIMIIIGGLTYMTAGGDEEKVKKARKLIINGLIGFAIVVAFSFIIGIVREIIATSLL